MRDLGPSDNHDLLRDPLIDEDAITLAHGYPIFSSITPLAHGAKLPLPTATGKLFCRTEVNSERGKISCPNAAA